jgi:hypothetical protein
MRFVPKMGVGYNVLRKNPTCNKNISIVLFLSQSIHVQDVFGIKLLTLNKFVRSYGSYMDESFEKPKLFFEPKFHYFGIFDQ